MDTVPDFLNFATKGLTREPRNPLNDAHDVDTIGRINRAFSVMDWKQTKKNHFFRGGGGEGGKSILTITHHPWRAQTVSSNPSTREMYRVQRYFIGGKRETQVYRNEGATGQAIFSEKILVNTLYNLTMASDHAVIADSR